MLAEMTEEPLLDEAPGIYFAYNLVLYWDIRHGHVPNHVTVFVCLPSPLDEGHATHRYLLIHH